MHHPERTPSLLVSSILVLTFVELMYSPAQCRTPARYTVSGVLRSTCGTFRGRKSLDRVKYGCILYSLFYMKNQTPYNSMFHIQILINSVLICINLLTNI